jgi:hypothetical protein
MRKEELMIIGIPSLVFVVGALIGCQQDASPQKNIKNTQQNAEVMTQAAPKISNPTPISAVQPEVVTMQKIAGQKCPDLIQSKTGSKVFFPYKTDTDGSTFVMYEWKGEKGSKFKTASCTVNLELGDVSKLVIDGKVLIGN